MAHIRYIRGGLVTTSLATQLRRAGSFPKGGPERPVTGHLRCIAERGRRGWQKASGYNRRALAEAAISRYKRVVGDALRSRTDRRQATEAAIGVHVLNRMLELGRPESVRLA